MITEQKQVETKTRFSYTFEQLDQLCVLLVTEHKLTDAIKNDLYLRFNMARMRFLYANNPPRTSRVQLNGVQSKFLYDFLTKIDNIYRENPILFTVYSKLYKIYNK